jgi:hypothetical protein
LTSSSGDRSGVSFAPTPAGECVRYLCSRVSKVGEPDIRAAFVLLQAAQHTLLGECSGELFDAGAYREFISCTHTFGAYSPHVDPPDIEVMFRAWELTREQWDQVLEGLVLSPITFWKSLYGAAARTGSLYWISYYLGGNPHMTSDGEVRSLAAKFSSPRSAEALLASAALAPRWSGSLTELVRACEDALVTGPPHASP